MEIKCKICGTVNDGSTNFCKGCFQHLDIDPTVEVEKEEPVLEEITPAMPVEPEENIHSKIIEENPEKIWENSNEKIEPVNETNIVDIEQIARQTLNNNGENSISEKIEDFSVNYNEENRIQELPIEEPKEEPVQVEDIVVEPMIEENNIQELSTQEIKEEPVQVEDTVVEPMIEEKNTQELPIEEPKEEPVQVEDTVIEPMIEENNTQELSIEEPKEEPVQVEDTVVEPIVEENSIQELPTQEIKEEPVQVEDTVVEPMVGENNTQELPVEENELSINQEINNKELPSLEETIKELDLENIHSKLVDEEEVEEKAEIKKVRRIRRTKSKELKVIDSNFKIILKFIFISVLVSIVGILIQSILNIFIALIFKINPIENNLINYVMTILINILVLMISSFITFRRNIPSENNANKMIITNYLIITVSSIIINVIQSIYINNSFYLASLLLPVVLVLIYGQLLYNFQYYIISKKADYKFKSIKTNNIIMILITIILLAIGAYSVQNKIELNFLKNKEIINEEDIINLTDEQYVYAFIDTAEKNILLNKINQNDYQIPSTINDITFVEYNGMIPESIELNINGSGIVTSGKIIYNGISYKYDGTNLSQE